MVRAAMIGLVLGGADCLWSDLHELEAVTGPWPGPVIAVNDAGVHWPRRLDHWATLHPEDLQPRLDARAENGYPGGFIVWAHERDPWHSTGGRHLVDRTLPVPTKTGSSGLFAVSVARAIGCERVVLCGVPMTATPHIGGGGPWTEVERFWPLWDAESLEDVRSMSGRTRDLLGAPDREWLGC